MSGHWGKDYLGRRKDAEFLIDFLKSRHAERKNAGIKGAYVLNVNAGWGFGKSFFLRGMAEDLRAHHPVVMINAWKNDFSDDPYTMVISEIDAFFQPLIKKIPPSKGKRFKKAYSVVRENGGKLAWMGLRGMTRKGAEKIFGSGVDEASSLFDNATEDGKIGDAVDDIAKTGLEAVGEGLQTGSLKLFDRVADAMIGRYQEVKNSQDAFMQSLQLFLQAFDALDKNYTLPMFVFIDELDRCRPPYAIALLERIKHLFDIEDIVFVIATDTEQLSQSVCGVYGGGFNGKKYLQRFFTRGYNLPDPEPTEFINAAVAATGTNVGKWQAIRDSDPVQYLGKMSSFLGMSLRDIERALEILLGITTTWHRPYPLQLSVMYPLICGFVSQQNIDDRGQNGPFRMAMKALAGWTITLPTRSGGVTGHQSHGIAEWSNTLFEAMAEPLDAVVQRKMDHRSRGPVEQDALRILSDELAHRTSEEYATNRPTIISQYPRMIVHAARMD
jgi:hypothetical protein